MKLWFVTIGEPVPLGTDFEERLHRAGIMATVSPPPGTT